MGTLNKLLCLSLSKKIAWVSPNSRKPGIFPGFYDEAYSAAGKTWFSWWLVEHYLPYHVNCPNSCGLGEPTRGRKDPPYFHMGYGSFDHIADLVDTLVESFLPLQ